MNVSRDDSSLAATSSFERSACVRVPYLSSPCAQTCVYFSRIQIRCCVRPSRLVCASVSGGCAVNWGNNAIVRGEASGGGHPVWSLFGKSRFGRHRRTRRGSVLEFDSSQTPARQADDDDSVAAESESEGAIDTSRPFEVTVEVSLSGALSVWLSQGDGNVWPRVSLPFFNSSSASNPVSASCGSRGCGDRNPPASKPTGMPTKAVSASQRAWEAGMVRGRNTLYS